MSANRERRHCTAPRKRKIDYIDTQNAPLGSTGRRRGVRAALFASVGRVPTASVVIETTCANAAGRWGAQSLYAVGRSNVGKQGAQALHCAAKKENRLYRHAKRSARVYRTEARSPRCLIRVGRPRSDGLCRDRNNVRKRGGQVGSTIALRCWEIECRQTGSAGTALRRG